MTSGIQTHNGFGKDRLRHSCHDMMIRILKTSDGYLSYRANQSMNQRLIQGDAKPNVIASVRSVRPDEDHSVRTPSLQRASVRSIRPDAHWSVRTPLLQMRFCPSPPMNPSGRPLSRSDARAPKNRLDLFALCSVRTRTISVRTRTILSGRPHLTLMFS